MAIKKTKSIIRKPAKEDIQESVLIPQNSQINPLARQAKRTKFIIGFIIVIGILLYFFRGLFVVAIVNGKPITRIEVIQQLEKQGGKKALDQLITKDLIFQEADKQSVKIGSKEIDDQMKKIDENLAKQGQNLDTALAAQGMTRVDLEDQIRIQKIVEKIFTKDIGVSNKEASDFVEQNKASFVEGTPQSVMIEQAKEQIRQQKLSAKFQPWLKDLQQKAKIYYIYSY